MPLGGSTFVVDIALLVGEAVSMLVLDVQEVVQVHSRIVLLLCLQQNKDSTNQTNPGVSSESCLLLNLTRFQKHTINLLSHFVCD